MAVASFPQNTDVIVDERWKIVRDTVVAILNKAMSQYSFQQVHHSVFQMCQQQRSGVLFDNLEAILSSHVNGLSDRLLRVAEETFLQSLKKEWDEFTLAVNYIGKTLLYLNNNYTCHGQTIPQMGERLFCDVVLRNAQLSEAFVKCVRGSLSADADAKRALKALGLKISQLYRDVLYEPQVEKPLIAVLTEQYRQEMLIKQCELDINGYVGWALHVIEDVEAKVSAILGEDTGRRVETSLGILLIKDNKERLLYSQPGGGAAMVEAMNIPCVHRLATALAKVGESESYLEMVVSAAIKMGTEALKDVSQADPVVAVEKLLALRDRLENLVLNLPGVSKASQSPVPRALAGILNENAWFAEKLAYYCDAKVRAKINEAELERVAADVFGLFRLLKSRDAFEHNFKLLIASRLINSKPEDPLTQENFLIDRLRDESGDPIVNHFDVMMKDVRMRVGLNNGFLRQLGAKTELPCEFHATVITTGVWPDYADPGIELPESMQHCMRLFRSYYLPRHNGRRLSFHTALGTVVFTLNHGKTYELVAPTSFVNTILCFQDGGPGSEGLSLQQISSEAKLSEGSILPQLESLLQLGLITVSRVNGVSAYAFNHAFSHPKSKLRLRAAGGNRATEDCLEPRTPRDSENSHAISIQAAIVQIIKSRKTMEHLQLCGCVTEALQKVGFAPSMTEIKQGLETLLKKGLLSRGRSPGVYVYET
ncbi:putative cullin-like protein [Trypanosoma conorhini]|uniref:Putative cullin-like protein n=1 Tax=Trypanosoma conorhini TaxID=83891 RepID=A0A422PAY3_9TRYP|nr:putative cullin-like protein [Trypanosoma conorhini]RNF14867.1 putative cullin-like protein [Trypanosoma conorhini]